MVILSVIFLLALSALILTIMITDALRGTVEVFSARNTFLIGLLLFQSVSASISLIAQDFGQVSLESAGRSSVIFTILLSLFVLIFFFSYSRGPWVIRLASRESVVHDASDAGLIFCAFAAVAAGLLMRFVLGPIPVFGVLTMHLAAGSFGVACGLAGWAWGRRPANFGVIAAAILVVLTCVAALLAYSFGRREVLGVLLTFAWALFYSRWRYSGAALLMVRTAFFGSIAFVFLALFTATRQGDEVRTPTEYLKAFADVSGAELTESVFALTNGQQAGSNSMWLIETRPGDFPYTTLHSLAYFVTHPIPRVIWESKYDSLGQLMVEEANMTRMATTYNVGPGVVGHIANDNPWIALPLYAFLLGIAMRFIDQRVRNYVEDPFIVVPLGAGLAQILALPRGELGLFAFQLTASIIGGWLVLRVVGPLVWRSVEPVMLDEESDSEDPGQGNSDRQWTEGRVEAGLTSRADT